MYCWWDTTIVFMRHHRCIRAPGQLSVQIHFPNSTKASISSYFALYINRLGISATPERAYSWSPRVTVRVRKVADKGRRRCVWIDRSGRGVRFCTLIGQGRGACGTLFRLLG